MLLRLSFRLLSKASLVLLVFLVLGSTASCGDSARDEAGEILEKSWRAVLVMTGSRADDTEALLDAMEIGKGDWAADVGSGEGDYTLPMAKRVGPSGRVFAVDVDPDRLDELNERLRENEIEHVTSVYSLEANPMLPANAVDAVLVRNAYHHFTAHESMLRHLKAALTSDGRLVIEESIGEDMVGKSREEQVEDHDLGLKYVREELKAAGFTIQKEVNPLMETNWGFYWMIVATPPASE